MCVFSAFLFVMLNIIITEEEEEEEEEDVAAATAADDGEENGDSLTNKTPSSLKRSTQPIYGRKTNSNALQ